MNFDLAAVDTAAPEGVLMPINGVDGQPIKNSKGGSPALVVISADTDIYRRYVRKKQMEAIRKARLKKPEDVPVDEAADEAEAMAIEQYVLVTIGWRDILDEKGEPIPFTKEAARELFTKYPMVGEQLDVFCGQRANFIKKPSKA